MYYESNMSEIEKEESYVPEATITPPQINNNNNSAFDLEQSLSSIAIINESNKRRSSDSNSKFPNNNNNNDDNENNYKNSAIYSKSPGAWSSGLCNFCDDVSGCCLTCWCPCITFGRIAEIADRGSTSCGVSGVLYTLICSVTGCCCLYSCFYRSKIRGQYYLKESPCSDCCVHCFCEECALCQEYRQLKYQGFDMSIGWHGNMERQKRLEAMTPVIQASMKR